MAKCITQNVLDEIFPPEKADAFFDAIYGGAEDGAYDIVLVCQEIEDTQANFAFELRRREGKCLKCSLTYGLPGVFQKHPIINANAVAGAIAQILGWDNFHWQINPTIEQNDDLHLIPFEIYKD